VWLSAGQLTDIVLEYQSLGEGAESLVKLEWTSVSIPGPIVVPPNKLFATGFHVQGSPFSFFFFPALRWVQFVFG
jgi:hypothetical protein